MMLFLTLLISVLLIGIATLHPFHFTLPSGFTLRSFLHSFGPGIAKNDFVTDSVRNVVLFIPFGFSISGLLRFAKWPARSVAMVVLLASLALTVAVESLQTLLIIRSPTISDIVANTAGGALGYVLFRLLWAPTNGWRGEALRRVEKVARPAPYVSLLLALGIYAALMMVLSQFLERRTWLTNWDTDFYLTIGNEHTGDRPWRGQVQALYILTESISLDDASIFLQSRSLPAAVASSLGAYFCPECDTTPASNTDVLFHELPAREASSTGMESTTPASVLVEQIVDSAQFTVLASIAAEESVQTGPARIVSISLDTVQRNLTLGQQGTDLVIRLRTPVTGNNGDMPEFHIPDVFTDSAYHQLIVTYEPPRLRVYVDDTENRFSIALAPELSLFHYLVPTLNWHVPLQANGGPIPIYKILYYALASISFFILFLLITFLFGRTKKVNMFLPNQKPEIKEGLL